MPQIQYSLRSISILWSLPTNSRTKGIISIILDPIKFIIAAAPRSGTRYMAHFLRGLGIVCGHEEFFTWYRQIYYLEREDEDKNRRIFGDSSWLAVPFLELMPPKIRIIHLIRDPLKAISSIQHIHFTIPKMKKDHPAHLWMDFAQYYGCGRDGEEFWYRWNKKIRRFSNLRIRIEEFDEDMAIKLLAYLGITKPEKCRELITAVLDELPRNLHHTMEIPQLTEFNNTQTRELAVELGYRKYA